ncbi:FMN reductase [Bradyrhizobium macuxiense]|uniref:FMN reductase n=1 Tax=Bradyrhizobium macuxiense TaxID=1755647 RepID=A0A120FJ57_9BRAD|nr:NAD(P)H-dependent oxidoreductase [Bradyrhizobium macuxiense]KWV48577.1 FMN reductase [Bradyrhizobium macuxiense]
MSWAPLIVGIGGTLRDGSTSEKSLRVALTEAARLGAKTQIFSGQSLHLPPYDPTERAPRATSMIEALRAADGVIIATPSYHGSISGLVKNALDYTEDLRADARAYLAGRAVGSIVCADGTQAMGATLATLRAIVHALRGWPTPFSAVINSAQRPFSADGGCNDPLIAQQLAFVAEQVVEFARMKRLFESRKASTDEREPETASAQCG